MTQVVKWGALIIFNLIGSKGNIRARMSEPNNICHYYKRNAKHRDASLYEVVE